MNGSIRGAKLDIRSVRSDGIAQALTLVIRSNFRGIPKFRLNVAVVIGPCVHCESRFLGKHQAHIAGLIGDLDIFFGGLRETQRHVAVTILNMNATA